MTAEHLVNDISLIRVESGQLAYIHMMFDTLSIVSAESSSSQSLRLTQQNWDCLNRPAHAQIATQLPELPGADFKSCRTSARMTLKARDARLLSVRHAKASNAVHAG